MASGAEPSGHVVSGGEGVVDGHLPLASGFEPSGHDPTGGVGGFGFCGHFVVVGSHCHIYLMS